MAEAISAFAALELPLKPFECFDPGSPRGQAQITDSKLLSPVN
jgi:hypothetical protein